MVPKMLAKDHLVLMNGYLMVPCARFWVDVLGMEQFGMIATYQDASLTTTDNPDSYLNDLMDDNKEITGSEGGETEWNMNRTVLEELFGPLGTLAAYEPRSSSQFTMPEKSIPGAPVPRDTSAPRSSFGNRNRKIRNIWTHEGGAM
jgi:hypothetical protein